MIRKQAGDVIYFQFLSLLGFEGLSHGFFSRYGGCSQGPFAELNCGASTDDGAQKVRANRRSVLEILGGQRLVFSNQVHGDRIVVLEGGSGGRDFVWETGESADAMITNQPGLFLAITVADCQAILFFDPEQRVVAAAHSGWRGSLQDIAGKTVRAMRDRFGCRPRDILACVGPSLGPCCAEFIHYKKEIPKSFWMYREYANHFDFWALTRKQLVFAGVPMDNVKIAEVCTKCGGDLFFSYRREKTTGRCVAAIGLSEDS